MSLLYCLWLLMELLGSQENHPLFVTISRSTCLFFFPGLCCPLLSLLPYHLPFLPGADRVPRHEQRTDNRDRPGASCPAGWAHCLPPLSQQSFSLSEVPFLVLPLFFFLMFLFSILAHVNNDVVNPLSSVFLCSHQSKQLHYVKAKFSRFPLK